MSTDYPQAIPMFVPEEWVFVNRWGYTGELSLVVHKTASPGQTSAKAIAAWFADKAANPTLKSSTYIVGLDGEIVQCALEKDGAGANCCLEAGHEPYWDKPGLPPNKNLCTISVEHVDPSADNSTPLSRAQQEASFALLADICKRHNIPAERVFAHHALDPINKARCPGNYPLDELKAHIAAGSTHIAVVPTPVPVVNGVPRGWSDDGTTLTAPNGHKVMHGFRAYVLKSNWDPENYPLEEEEGRNPLEDANPSLGTGTQQVFRWTVLEWTQARGVFVAWAGQELLKLRQELAAVKK
jgi:hypothetical protein